MKKNIFDTAVIVGHGSIGKVHHQHLFKISKNLLIVDPVVQKIKNTNNVNQICNIDALDNSSSKNDLVVISNWGPDHLTSMQMAVSKGFRQFIIEKPMVTSMHELKLLTELVKTKSLKVVVNQGWHYENLAEKINWLGGKFSLGNLHSIVTYGGARCLSTGGSHIIHLANMIFKSKPVMISSNLNLDNINPRSSNLIYVEGNAFVKFESGSLSINYTNQSTISGETKIFWRDAIGTLKDTNLTIMRRSKKRKYRNIITRYGDPDLRLFSADLTRNRSVTTKIIPPIYYALHDNSASNLLKDFNNHVISNEILLCCLISNQTQKIVTFRERLPNKLARTSFKIS